MDSKQYICLRDHAHWSRWILGLHFGRPEQSSGLKCHNLSGLVPNGDDQRTCILASGTEAQTPFLDFFPTQSSSDQPDLGLLGKDGFRLPGQSNIFRWQLRRDQSIRKRSPRLELSDHLGLDDPFLKLAQTQRDLALDSQIQEESSEATLLVTFETDP